MKWHFALIAMLVAACASSGPHYSKQALKVIADQVRKQPAQPGLPTTISGPVWSAASPNLTDLKLNEDGSALRLKVVQGLGGQISEVELAVAIVYHARSWNLFDYSNLDSGEFPKTKIINRESLGCDNGSCGFRETLSITLPSTLLERTKGSGFELRVNGENGSAEIVSVPGLYVQGFLMGVAQLSVPAPGAATSTAAAAPKGKD